MTTIKENYLDKELIVNFYEAKEVPRKYEVKIEPIDDFEKHINSLLYIFLSDKVCEFSESVTIMISRTI